MGRCSVVTVSTWLIWLICLLVCLYVFVCAFVWWCSVLSFLNHHLGDYVIPPPAWPSKPKFADWASLHNSMGPARTCWKFDYLLYPYWYPWYNYLDSFKVTDYFLVVAYEITIEPPFGMMFFTCSRHPTSKTKTRVIFCSGYVSNRSDQPTKV